MKKLLFALLLTALSTALPAQITLSTEAPVEGAPIIIQLEKPTGQLIITYRPNSAVTQRDTLTADPAATAFEWTPDRAGIVSLSAPEQGSLNVSIRFKGISGSGIAVMLVAASLLFGGAAFAFRLLFKDVEEDGTLDIDLDHMPDT